MKTHEQTQSAEGGSLPRLVRRFRLRGICLVPTECEMIVEALTPEAAIQQAKSTRWQDHIDNQGGDNTSAFDWQPVAEEIDSANSPDKRNIE